ncbi:PHP domain-containing protein [Prolixibacteraceae bacterium JC049]|nr:PHP domain-containing protein [Prolixibacteraceae bacterium JC049]
MNLYKQFPPAKDLTARRKENPGAPPLANGHIHTPYSFSAFKSIEQAFMLAKEQNIQILGINDFYVTDGYPEFYEQATTNAIFPLFNVEFMALDKQLQSEGIQVNDPANPGRIYFSGKGLNYPLTRSAESDKVIESLREGTNNRTAQMIEKLNAHFQSVGVDIELNFEWIKTNLAKGLVRERHVAKAVWVALSNKYERITRRLETFHLMFGGRLLSNPENEAEITNEIRNRFLKQGNVAYVEESDDAFINLETAIEVIKDSGGIPCYPVLLDDKNGDCTPFESNWEQMVQFLKERNICCVELIPQRNSCEKLSEFVHFFNNNGFIVLFGTEHNTPVMTPLTIHCSNQTDLPEEIAQIGYEGTCVVAAHQYQQANGEKGYEGANKQDWINLGDAVINWYLSECSKEIKAESTCSH